MKTRRILSLVLVMLLAAALLLPGGRALAASRGWRHSGGGWWYQEADGSWPADQWARIGGAWYHFDRSGYMQTGWQKIGGSWYWFDGSGAMVTGWQKIGGSWYWFDGSGAMVTGWQKIGGSWYRFDGSGAMVTGWQKIGGGWYRFSGSGAMQTGWQKIGGAWYYFDRSGTMRTGWQKIGGSWYWFDGSGAMATGTRTIGGTTYTFGSDGAWIEDSAVTPSGLGLPDSFTFSSGVGGWATTLEIGEDWSFTGSFHDSNMGESGDGYQATVYYCNFHGEFTRPVRVKDGIYSMDLVYLETEDETGSSYIRDGARYVASDPYGMDNADEFILYMPYTDQGDLAEGFSQWAKRMVSYKYFLPGGVYGLYNVGGQEGFVGFGEEYPR